MQTITPFLWFNNNAEEAINLYTSLFKDSKIYSITHYPNDSGEMSGKVLTAVFDINGQRLMALDGGPTFMLSEAFSLFVECDTQEEVDFLWEKLLEGGTPQQCGWLKDRFGLSWQIIPKALGKLMNDPDPQKSQRVIQAMLSMVKIDIKVLEDAYNGT
ncbi:VOC family protein [candidate division WWE3 bacterium]|nr:VOC family protein [candidate division WWE3 bacterium]